MIKLVTFMWSRPGYRSQYTPAHVNAFYKMAARYITVPYEPLCITDWEHDIKVKTKPLWANPSPSYGANTRPNCFYRLRMFDSTMAKIIGRFVWMDLDCVMLGNLDHLFTNTAEFGIWKPDGELMPCNGSLVLHTPGTRPRTWTDFNPKLVDSRWGLRKVVGFHGSDQAWIAHKLTPHDYIFGQKDGVFSYRSHILDKPKPDGAKLVFFNGRHNPWDDDVAALHPWLGEHYRSFYRA